MLLMTSSRRRRWHPTAVLLPGKSHGRRSLVGCSPWGREELDMTEWLHFHLSLSRIGEGNGNLLQCPCLENPRDGGAWWADIYGVAQSRTRLKGLSSSSMTSSDVSFIYIFLFLVMLGLRCYTWAFSSYGDEGSSLLWCVGHCGGCSCCGVLALGVQASCSAPRHVESSQTRDRTSVPCIARQILIHCTTRKAPKCPVWRCLGQTSDLQSPSPWHSSYKTSRLLWLVWFLHCSKPNLWSLCSDCLNPCGWYLWCGFISCSILLSFSLCSDLSISFVSVMLHDFYIT